MDLFENSIALQMGVSLIVGITIGLERELRGKAAGLRTFALICMGSTIFTIISKEIGYPSSTDRIASNIVTGIGFLGAGVIFKEQDRVAGLTTAAAIWATSSLGMAIGEGKFWLSVLGTIAILTILVVFHYVEKGLNRLHLARSYRIVYQDPTALGDLCHDLFKKYNLSSSRGPQSLHREYIVSNWKVRGKRANHEAFIAEMMKDPKVRELGY
ncbi:MgtC/SapB family protein [Siphonobacter aquaeclarae]|uniref:Putative Mg2+ transporter-C (MgtC) family protein n=1 Tax=Siphonobacter aquaeclarae TaxID=563176 RepID=A0A1G9PLU0_9BACT|nr:MgtC/SapB family protein [Siphonobacter aquaeclarae]SDL99187.1 putative Mg2+ transporter-C (MgtC) family protein [Siphonobacter aquaeclarae]